MYFKKIKSIANAKSDRSKTCWLTKKIVHNNKLYIKLKSSTLRNEFTYQKTDLVNQINKRFGKKIIEDIILK